MGKYFAVLFFSFFVCKARGGWVFELIKLAYDELRQSLSRRVYNKAYDKLESPYKEMIDNAVPIRVYMAEI